MKTKNRKKIVITGKKGSREKDTLRRMGRIVGILCKLDNGPVNVHELAEYYDIDKRNIQKDLKLIDNNGYPLDKEPLKATYRFAPGIGLRNHGLLQDEGNYHTFAALSKFSLSSGMPEDPLNRLFSHVGMTSEPDPDIVFIMPRVIKPNIPYMKELHEAMDLNKEVKIEFQSAPDQPVKHHTICPLKIIMADGFPYVFCCYKNDTDKKRFPKYRLDRIKSLEIVEGEGFRTPYNLQDELQNARNVWGLGTDSRPKTPVKLRIAGYARDYFRTHEVISGQEVAANKDGTLTYTANIGMPQEIIPHILRWLPHITVLAPKELKEEVQKHIRDYSKAQK